MPRKPASERVRREWLRRVEAEYRSAAITQHLVLWLIQIGASPDLVHAGLRIVRDELAHASLSQRAMRAAGGEDKPLLARESLALPRSGDPLEDDVARACVDVFCLGETVAVRLFKALRDGCTVPAARRVLDRVLRDEVRHRDFGWTLLEWLFESPQGPALRTLVERELPRFVERLRVAYAPRGISREAPPSADEVRWGLMPAARYRQVLTLAFQQDHVPRFARLGIDARHAWA